MMNMTRSLSKPGAPPPTTRSRGIAKMLPKGIAKRVPKGSLSRSLTKPHLPDPPPRTFATQWTSVKRRLSLEKETRKKTVKAANEKRMITRKRNDAGRAGVLVLYNPFTGGVPENTAETQPKKKDQHVTFDLVERIVPARRATCPALFSCGL
jgi:hypothetical protein